MQRSQLTSLLRSVSVAASAAAIAPLASAGDVIVEATGVVVQASVGGSSPFVGTSPGDAVVVHFEVFVPGTPVAPGQLENYMIDPATSFIRIGAVTDSLTGGNVGIQNDFPVADGIRVFGAPAAGGGSVSFEVGESSGTLFSSTDITMQVGSWPSSTWSSFSFMLAGGGSFIEFSNPDVSIFLPPIGTNYCGPAASNSSGSPAEISGTGSAILAQNNLGLVASSLPTNSFGYFLCSQTQDFVMNPVGSQGNLCLGGSIGRFVGQIQSSGTAGSISISVDLTQIPQPMGAVAGQVGEDWSFQAWFRDANPNVTSNLTDGLEITLQ